MTEQVGNSLRNQHSDDASRFERLRSSAVSQIVELLATNNVTLGVPIESRVKSWNSIEEKILRKDISLSDVRDLDDLVGVRIILLFRSDLERVVSLIGSAFEVVSSEDTAERLGDARFGYQSQHMVVRIPREWLKVPSFALLGDLKIELQVRTLAQHIWAAASHTLQYKNEESVPPPIRRAINRASALLETVDLEFERVLAERRSYVESASESSDIDSTLNVDTLALVLSEELPTANKKDDEPYADLLENLRALGVTTVAELRRIIRARKERVLRKDAEMVAERLAHPDLERYNMDRLKQGVFLAHVGLARRALRDEFGYERVSEVMNSKTPDKPKQKRGSKSQT